MTPDPPGADSLAGIRYATLVFAFLGAAVSLSYTREMKRGQALAAVIAGASFSVAATPLVLHYLGMPETLEQAVAFFAGLGAMRAVPVFFSLIDRVRDTKLPWLADHKDPKE